MPAGRRGEAEVGDCYPFVRGAKRSVDSAADLEYRSWVWRTAVGEQGDCDDQQSTLGSGVGPAVQREAGKARGNPCASYDASAGSAVVSEGTCSGHGGGRGVEAAGSG